MRRNKSRFPTYLIAMGMGLAVSACATTDTLTPGIATSSGFGEAVRFNIAQQSLKPSEAQKQDRMIPADPDRRKLAIENYKQGEVPEPVAVQTGS